MNDRFQEMQLFVRVAETGSFSRAGRELGHAQPTVSRIISALEARLGVKLLARTTRKVLPTEAGALLLEKARLVLADVEELESSVRGAGGLTGVLRVATPVTFGAREIVPVLGPFLATHPRLRVELLMADRRVDLLEEGVDLAIRMGALDDSGLVSRRLATAPRFVVASPGYLALKGEPLSPAALISHDIITVRPSGIDVWKLRHSDGGETSVRLQARLVTTSTEGAVAAALAGLGLAALSRVACGAELARGDLVRVLPAHSMAPVDVHAVFAAGHRPPAKARAFIDYLASTLAG
jgi:DNA-binding transcriptional LysR family regulator